MIINKYRIFSIYFTFLLCSTFVLSSNLITSVEAGYIIPQVEIYDPSNPDGSWKLAEVAPGDSGTVMFTGRVYVTEFRPHLEQIFISLKARSDRSGDTWGALVYPPEILLTSRQMEHDISVFVTAPPFTDVSEWRHIIIDGTWIGNPSSLSGEVIPSSVNVGVAPYIRYFASLGEGYKRVWPGQTAYFTMNVFNIGNRNESFHVSINDLDSLTKAGFAVTFPTEYIEVEADTKGEFKFRVMGTVKNFHPWRTYLSTISLHVVPVHELPDGEIQLLEQYAWNIDFYYYEFGPSFPEPCIFGIIIAIVFLVVIYYYLKKKSKKKKREHRRRMRRKQRQMEQEQADEI